MADSAEVIEAKSNKDDRQYFLNIVKTMPLLIEWANDKIKDDKEVMLEAVKVDGDVKVAFDLQ